MRAEDGDWQMSGLEDGEGAGVIDVVPVEVAFGTPDRQVLISLEVSRGTTAMEAAQKSGITREFPAIDLENDPMGIFSNLLNGKDWPLPSDYVLQPGDRVEIYRPLQIDPKQARLKRADKESPRKKTDKEKTRPHQP